jgi:hypothetical protein
MGEKKLASSTPKGAPRDSAKQVAIYEELFTLNHNFDEILVRVDRLRDLGLFRNRFQRQSIAICQATLKETRAWFNFEILQILEDREERGLAYFGRIRHELEKALAGSGKSAPHAGRIHTTHHLRFEPHTRNVLRLPSNHKE